MNMRKTVFAIVGAASLLLGGAGTTLAQVTDTGDVDVQVTAAQNAVLAVTLTAADFSPVAYSNADQTATGSTLTVDATDTRGTAAGWSVTLGGIDFDGAATTDSIAIGNLALASGTITGGPGTAPTGSGIAGVTGVGQTVLTAAPGAGNGAYTQSLAGSLLVDGGTLVDTYTTTITVTISGAAP